ncbi:MAG: leucine-rich repeat protein [Candidatus Altimarinota bacterium]
MEKQITKTHKNILNKQKGFTLVELIIVITILAILATIAFISFKSYSGNARDGNRVTALSNIQKGLDIYQVKVGKYPHPDNLSGTGTFGGETLNYVGQIGDNISRVISMNKTPIDPKTQNNYVYGVSSNYQKYQLATTLEELEAGIVVPTTYAAQGKAKVVGNYTYPLRLGPKIYSLPSLIFVGSGDLISDSTFTGFIVNNSGNLPYSLDGQLSNNVSVTEQLQQITGTGNLTLTGVDIGSYTSIESLTGATAEQIAASLGVSVKDLGNILFNNTSGNNSAGPISGGESETPQPEATPENYFTFDSSTHTITGYNFQGPKDVVIPSKIGGVDVLIIGGETFSSLDLTSVIIPNGIREIGYGAFLGNQLTSISLPNSLLNIMEFAFSDNQLTNVTIPNSVTTIGSSAFSYNQLTNVTIPNGVTTIGSSAFSYNQLTNVTIPNSVTDIGQAAFNGNKLPDNQAFIYKRNSDESIDNTILISYGGANKTPTIPNSVTTIGSYAFSDNQLTSVTIPNSVTTIGDSAFWNNELANVTIPSGVTTIGSYAFAYNKLTSIMISSNITTIPEGAFRSNKLANVSIPNSVTSIGVQAFNFNQLTSVTIPANVATIGNSAFLNNDLTLTSINFQRNTNTTIGTMAFGDQAGGLSGITQNVYGVWNKISNTWTKQ